jgi:hypothetical protein
MNTCSRLALLPSLTSTALAIGFGAITWYVMLRKLVWHTTHFLDFVSKAAHDE